MPRNEDEIGALWQKTSAKGDYMTGTINGQRVVVFQNTKRDNEKAPNWRVLKSRPREEASGVGGPVDDGPGF